MLPPELEIQIFESVAKEAPYDAVLRLRLMLVARRVRIWIEPLVFECIVFSRANNWTRLKHIIASKPPDFLARNVKSVCMPLSTVSTQEASEILSLCTGAQRIACWIDHREIDTAIPWSIPIQTPALRRLSIELSHFLSLSASFPAAHLISGLTHLELIWWDKHTYPAVLDLAFLRNLTHLALRGDSRRYQWPLQMVAGTLNSCRHLKLLVLLDYGVGDATLVRLGLRDPRAVLVISEVALHDWEPKAKRFHEWEVRLGPEDMWTRGEGMMRRSLPLPL
ncbi:hypothetical protein B0H16DRAFT_1711687 [Mycena metata]|uniref:Uncharacterized protein n=1 Tax=Mycena metata TaxID=1033252 RepID=A0AAD7NWI3_9AGAR|nr:hypothetical protein B0H16DRAFT_1711687 [Mycena metata]